MLTMFWSNSCLCPISSLIQEIFYNKTTKNVPASRPGVQPVVSPPVGISSSSPSHVPTTSSWHCLWLRHTSNCCTRRTNLPNNCIPDFLIQLFFHDYRPGLISTANIMSLIQFQHRQTVTVMRHFCISIRGSYHDS